MYEYTEKTNVFKYIIAIVLVIWSFATIRYGFYVDENGLLTIYKGIYQGQRMFVDSWEALQTGGILAYPLMALYYNVLQPLFDTYSINVGLVLYMRYCYLTVKLIVAVYLYVTLKDSEYEKGAFLAAAFYYMYVVDWKNFSYKSYCDIAMILIVCFIFRFYQTRKSYYALLTAVAVCISVLAYPTMIIMAVFIGAFWLYMAIKDEASKWTIISYTIACLVIGLAVVIFLQLNSGWDNILAQISNLGDQDYDAPMYIRLGQMLLQYVAFAAISYIPIGLTWLINKVKGYEDEYIERAVLSIYFVAFIIAICALRWESISVSRFVYGNLIIFFWFPYFMRNKESGNYVRIGAYGNRQDENKKILWIVFIFSCVAQFVWSISTNQGISVPGHMALYVVLIMILLFSDEDIAYPVLRGALAILAIFFMGIWVADSNGGFCSALDHMVYVERGALKGVAVPEEEYYLNESVMNLLDEYVTEEDTLLVAFGANSAGYLNSDAWQGTYSVYARTQLNTKLIDYYEINPDNMADYMLLDTGHDKYQYFLENETGQYLLNLYPNEVAQEGDCILLSR